eukprot:TRINITY_DN4771_c0_g1_i25.p1 TRINITY_DN4771_c0_g1~~TRINITY_DN4771_c0_g1_i25.p1  ORF type:complete len:218 (+),score=33.59 TRINITY_DN4771_c0_g1_i25:79-732(+)
MDLFRDNKRTSRIKKEKTKREDSVVLSSRFVSMLDAGVDLKSAVKAGSEDRNEWISMHTIEIFHTVRLVYDQFTTDNSCCTVTSCPTMCAYSPKGDTVYLWADERNKKPTELSAPEYISTLFDWVEVKLQDESIFPATSNFGKHFIPEVSNILKRLFRVYAHILYKHKNELKASNLEEQFILGFTYFYWFVLEFKLVSLVDMAPLETLIFEINNKTA